MMTISSRVAATAVASLFLISSAFAQTTAPATPAPAAKMAPAEKKAEKPPHRGIAAMLEGRRCQEPPRQGAQEIHVRMQEGGKGRCRQAEDVTAAATDSP